jgi:hypothetical protein
MYCIYGFCMVLTVNIDYFLNHHKQIHLFNGEVYCSL